MSYIEKTPKKTSRQASRKSPTLCQPRLTLATRYRNVERVDMDH